MTFIDTLVLASGTLIGVVTLFFVVAILRGVVLLHEAVRMKPTQCRHIVTYGCQEEALCVLPLGHRDDHAVTLASVEACGYNQPPF